MSKLRHSEKTDIFVDKSEPLWSTWKLGNKTSQCERKPSCTLSLPFTLPLNHHQNSRSPHLQCPQPDPQCCPPCLPKVHRGKTFLQIKVWNLVRSSFSVLVRVVNVCVCLCVCAGRVEVGRVLLKLARTLLEQHTPLRDLLIGCLDRVELKDDIKSQNGKKKKTCVRAGLTGFPGNWFPLFWIESCAEWFT